MKLEHLRVVNDSVPSRQRIKDALVELPDEVILKIIADYNKDNNLKPVYKNTPENVSSLKEEGRNIQPYTEDNFAFLSPTPYGGVEGFNSLEEKYDYDVELAPYVEANYTTYEKDLGIDDEFNPKLLNADWLRSHWRKLPPFSSKAQRLGQARNILKKVYDLNEMEFYKKLEKIYQAYDNDEISYNRLKKDFIELFTNNMPKEGTHLTEEEQTELRKYAANAYNKKYNENIKYEKLPRSWKEKLDPLLDSGRKDNFKAMVDKFVGKKEEDTSLQGLREEFKEIFGFSSEDKQAVINFASSKDVASADEYYDCIKETFEAFNKSNGKKPSYEQAVKYFKNIKHYPDNYRSGCKEWYDVRSAEEKSEDNKKRLGGNSQARSIVAGFNKNEDLAKKIEIIKADKYYHDYYEEQLESYKELLQEGKIDKNSAKKQMQEVIEYCFSRIQNKSKGSLEKAIAELEKNLTIQEKAWFNTVYAENTKAISEKNVKALTTEIQSPNFKKELEANGVKNLEGLAKKKKDNGESVKEFFRAFIVPSSKSNKATSKLFGSQESKEEKNNEEASE